MNDRIGISAGMSIGKISNKLIKRKLQQVTATDQNKFNAVNLNGFIISLSVMPKLSINAPIARKTDNDTNRNITIKSNAFPLSVKR